MNAELKARAWALYDDLGKDDGRCWITLAERLEDMLGVKLAILDINGAAAMAENLFPGVQWQCGEGGRVIAAENGFAVLDWRKHHNTLKVETAHTAALALCRAILRRWIDEQEGEDRRPC